MSSIRDFLNSVSQGDNISAQDHIEAALSSKAFEALDAKKQEIAGTLFTGHTGQQETSETE